MSKIILTIVLLTTLASITHSCKHVNSKFNYTNFYVDSIKTIQFDYGSIFVKSPFEETNKIWISGYELDLDTEKKILLSEKYDKSLRTDNLQNSWKDLKTGELFIGIFHEYLLYFDKEKNKKIFNIKTVQSLLNGEKKILVGSADGLYEINKESTSINKIKGISENLWINNLQILNHDTLLINNVIKFRLNTDDYKNINKGLNIERPLKYKKLRENNKNSKIELPNSLEQQYKSSNDDEGIWYYNDKNVYFVKYDQTTFNYIGQSEKIVKFIETDENHIYMVYEKQIDILNKRYLLNKIRPVNVENYNIQLKQLKSALDFDNDISLDSFKSNYTRCKSSFKDFNNIESQNIFQSAVASYFYQLYDKEKVDEIEKAIINQELDDEFKKYSLLGLCKYYIRNYNVSKYKKYLIEKEKYFPEFNYDYSNENITIINKALSKVDSLKLLDLSADEFLFKVAAIKNELIQNGWFESESMYDNRIVVECYEKILQNYPSGKFAEEADLFIILNAVTGEDGFWYSEDLISDLEKHIQKYKSFSNIGKAQLVLSEVYSTFYSEEIDEVIAKKEKAIEILKLIDTTQLRNNDIKQRILEYQNSINKELFEFSVEAFSPEFHYNKEMNFLVKIKNRSKKDRNILLYENPYLFSTDIGKAKFEILNDKKEIDSIKVTISSSETYSKTINLSNEILNWNGNLGKYNFQKQGIYYITLFSFNRDMSSNQCKFYVYK